MWGHSKNEGGGVGGVEVWVVGDEGGDGVGDEGPGGGRVRMRARVGLGLQHGRGDEGGKGGGDKDKNTGAIEDESEGCKRNRRSARTEPPAEDRRQLDAQVSAPSPCQWRGA